MAPETLEPSAKVAGAVLKRMRVYEVVHVPVVRPISALDALKGAGASPGVRTIGGQPFVDAVNNRHGHWIFAVDGEFPEGGRIVRLGTRDLVNLHDLECFPRGVMEAEFATQGPKSTHNAVRTVYAQPWQRTLLSWFRVSLA